MMVRVSRIVLALMVAGTGSAMAADAAPVTPVVTQDYAQPAQEESRSRVSGFVEGSFAKEIDNSKAETWNLRGSANLDAGRGFNLQADLGYAYATLGRRDVNRFAGQAHAYYRSEDYAVGAFFHAAQTDVGAISDTDNYAGGIEAAYLADQGTLYGRFGYGVAQAGNLDLDQLAGVIGARVYANDNLRFDVEGGWQNLSHANLDLDTVNVKLAGLYRLESVPVTLFAGYQYVKEEVTLGALSASGDSNILFAGARVSFGSTSLKDEERNGVLWQ